MYKLNVRYLQEMAEGGAPEAAPEAEQPSSLISGGEPQSEEGGWYLMEGMKGEGEPPEWFNAGKYKTLADQAKAQRELEKKLGAHTGAPEKYELPEGMAEDDELVKAAMEAGQEFGINQDAFNKFLEIASAGLQVSQEVKQEVELQKLGDNANERLGKVEAFLKNKFEGSPDKFQQISQLVTTAESVQLIEAMMEGSAPAQLPKDEAAGDLDGGWEAYEAAMLKRNENGELLMSVDMDYREKVNKMRRQMMQ